MTYPLPLFADLPSETTPTSAANFNLYRSAINDIDTRLDTAESSLVTLDSRLDIAEPELVSLDSRLDVVESQFEIKRFGFTSTDIGAATATSVNIAAPALTATATNGDDADGPSVNHATSTTANNATGMISAFTQSRRDWRPTLEMIVKSGSTITSMRFLAGLFSASPDAVPTPTTLHGAWFRLDTGFETTQWAAVVAGGGTPTVVQNILSFAANTKYKLSISFGASDVKFYINGVLEATVTTTLPTLTTPLGYGIRLTTLISATRNFKWGWLRLIQG